MAPTKRPRPRVGDTIWTIRNLIEIGMVDPEHPEYGYDPDDNKFHYRHAATREEAERIALELWAAGPQFAVAFYQSEFVPYDEGDAARYPHAGYWEQISDDYVVEDGTICAC